MSLLEELPKGIILRVRDGGLTLLELDDNGEVTWLSETLELQSTVPERIISAAAGGMDVTNLPPGLEVILAEDVEVIDYGETALEGQWIKLRLPAGGLDKIRGTDLLDLTKRLGLMGSTWRAVIFEADLVHREDEPE